MARRRLLDLVRWSVRNHLPHLEQCPVGARRGEQVRMLSQVRSSNHVTAQELHGNERPRRDRQAIKNLVAIIDAVSDLCCVLWCKGPALSRLGASRQHPRASADCASKRPLAQPRARDAATMRTDEAGGGGRCAAPAGCQDRRTAPQNAAQNLALAATRRACCAQASRCASLPARKAPRRCAAMRRVVHVLVVLVANDTAPGPTHLRSAASAFLPHVKRPCEQLSSPLSMAAGASRAVGKRGGHRKPDAAAAAEGGRGCCVVQLQ